MRVKLGQIVAGRVEPYQHANTFIREKTHGIERVLIGPRGGHRFLVEMLAATIGPPYKVLYVLHTSRTGARLARYESPVLEPDELRTFLARYGDFIAQDSRHDLWVAARGGAGTIVWDRHDLVYAYGPLDAYVSILEQGGLREGWPNTNLSHAHYYHAEWDDTERSILREFEWIVSPLHPEDLQTREPDLPA
jgi:hypothetical protein